MSNAVREEFRVEALSEPLSHYTDAVRYGDVLYVSGIAPLDAGGKLVGADDAVAQTRQVLENMQLILEAAGTDFSQTLRVTVYLTDVADRTRINPVRQEFFGDAKPASTLIGISELAVPGMKVEIEAIVAIPQS